MPLQPAPGWQREQQIHQRRAGAQQPDLKAGRIQAGGIHRHERQRAARQHAKPKNIRVQLAQVPAQLGVWRGEDLSGHENT